MIQLAHRSSPERMLAAQLPREPARDNVDVAIFQEVGDGPDLDELDPIG